MCMLALCQQTAKMRESARASVFSQRLFALAGTLTGIVLGMDCFAAAIISHAT
jgi:hypothetical protein